MWSMLIILVLTCGQSIAEIPGFGSEEKCKDAIPKVRAGYIGQSPLIDCVQK